MDLEVYETKNGGDLLKTRKDLSVLEGLSTPVYLALFSKAPKSKQWWGDELFFKNQNDKQYNSQTESVLHEVALNSAGRVKIEEAVKADLQHLESLADISVNVAIEKNDQVKIDIVLIHPDSQEENIIYIWDATCSEILTNRERYVVFASEIGIPANLTANALSKTEISLIWQNTGGNQTQTQIERSLDGVDYQIINTISSSITSYNDQNLLDSTRYYYRIKYINQSNSGQYSNTVSEYTFYSFRNALRFDSDQDDQARWEGTQYTLPDKYTVVAWVDIDDNYPDFDEIFEGRIWLASDTTVGNNTNSWSTFMAIQSGTGSTNNVRFGAGVFESTLYVASTNIPNNWTGRMMITGRIRRIEAPGATSNAITISVRGKGVNGSADFYDTDSNTPDSGFSINHTVNLKGIGRANGGSIVLDVLEVHILNAFLTVEEERAIWSDGNGKSLNEFAKVAEYLLNEESGNTAIDTANGRNLTLTNFTGVNSGKWVTPLHD